MPEAAWINDKTSWNNSTGGGGGGGGGATFLAICLILGIIAGSAWVYSSQLPAPEHANRDELLRWLVTRDLGQESAHTRAVLARRLDSEFVDVDWEKLGEQMSVEHRQRLWENMPCLLEPWFMGKLDGYGQCDEARRQAYVDAIIDRMSELSGMNCLRETSESQSSPKLAELLMENVEQWKKQAPPEKKQRMGEFLAAIQTRWLIRTFREN